MRVFLGLISLILVVFALMLLGADMISSLEMRGHIVVRSVAAVWDAFDKGGPDLFRAWCAGHLPLFLQNAANWLLGLYGWAVPAVIGVPLAFFVSRKRADA
jgi:hypothetical protein